MSEPGLVVLTVLVSFTIGGILLTYWGLRILDRVTPD